MLITDRGSTARAREGQDMHHVIAREESHAAKIIELYLSTTSGLSLDDVIQKNLSFFMAQLGIACCSIAIRESSGVGVRLYSLNNNDLSCQDSGDSLSQENSLLCERTKSRKPIYRRNITEGDAGFEFESTFLKLGIRSDYTIPLWISDNGIGTLSIASDQIDGICALDRHIIEVLTPALSQSLWNIGLVDKLEKSNRIWQAIAKYSSDHIILLNEKLIIQYANYDLLDMKREKMLGRSVFACFPKSAHVMGRLCFSNALNNAAAGSFEVEYVCAQTTCYFEASVGPVMNADDVVGIIINIRDITKRKLVEKELRQSAVVVENTADAVVITDENQIILSINTAFTQITGFTKEDAIGKTPKILQSGRQDKVFYKKLWDTLLSEGHWQGEIWNRRKNGEVFPVWETISVVYGDQNKINNFVSVFSDISVIKKSQEKMDYLAYHDPLTQLPNRLLFKDRLNHALQRAKRDNQQLAVLFLDLDRFKIVNDTLGHPVGDKLICAAAKRIFKSVRREDTIARIGGDEFVIMTENLKEIQDISVMAEHLVDNFIEPFFVDTHELKISLSIGISIYPRHGEDYETLIKNADLAMYRVKEEGRNNYRFYEATDS